MPERRIAYEDYVRASDRWYWNRTKELISRSKKETAALVAASTAVSVAALITAVSCRFRRSRR